MKILAVGCGGAGSNIVRNLNGISKVLVNTDSDSDIRMVPENVRGTGGDSLIGRALAEDYEKSIDSLLTGYDSVIVAAGLGGGTGTGMAPLISQRARSLGARCVAFVCLPMVFEGRRPAAKDALMELISFSDRIFVMDLERVGTGDASFEELLKKADVLAGDAVLRISEMLRGPFFSLFSEKVYTISVTDGGLNREAFLEAVSSPLFEADPAYGKIIIQTDGESYRKKDEVFSEVGSITGILPEIIESGRPGTYVFIPVSSLF
ncbi:MAG: hypothetical protein ACOX8L_04870 [Candidatus Methanomethylophilaceae archaeon]